MSRNRLWIAALFAVAVLAVSAAAQDEKNELGGIIGRTFISDQGIQNANYFDPTIHFGKGLTFGAEYGRKFWVTPIYSLAGEGVLAYNYDIDLNAGTYGHAVVPTDIKSLFVTPAVRANLFPTTAVSPWVSLGAGFGRFSENKQLDYSGTNTGTTKSAFVLQGGLGLDVRAWKQLSVRGEVRDFWSGEPDFPLAPTGKTRMHNYFVGLGVFYRF